MFRDYLSGFPAFMAHYAVALAYVAIFVWVYTRITRHDEFALLRDGNMAAGVALAGALLGFAQPLASAVEHSVSLTDNVIWATISLIIQIGTYFVIKLTIPDLNARIERGEVGMALWLAAASISAGLLAAAAMTT